jgi:hypothetical protein
MSATSERTLLRLQAYHDGELSGLARWWLERRLRRSPALRAELAALARVGEWVRDAHVEEPAPDLWDAIALRLPAADARRADAGGARRSWVGWLAVPGVVASAAIAAVLAFYELASPPPPATGVVRWLDSGGRDVMVLEADPDTTIIWIFDAPKESMREDGGNA